MADVADPVLDDPDRHHLERVLRLRPGEAVTVSDGHGGWRRCVYAGAGRLDAADAPTSVPRPSPPITVAFAMVKGDRPDWIVQKLTEAGVDRIVPFVAGRTVVRWDGEKGGRRVERLRTIARSAAMQSRRAWLSTVEDLCPFETAVGLLGRDGVALADPGGDPPSLSRPSVLVGPEGGWDDSELAVGLPRVGLGPNVFRSETAALAAGLLLCALREQIVRPVDSP